MSQTQTQFDGKKKKSGKGFVVLGALRFEVGNKKQKDIKASTFLPENTKFVPAPTTRPQDANILPSLRKCVSDGSIFREQMIPGFHFHRLYASWE